MAVKLLNTKRVKGLKAFFLAALLIVLAMVVYFPNYSRIKILRRQNQELIEQMATLKAEIAEHKVQNQRLEEGFFYERIARDRLGVAKEDEIVVDIQE